MRTVTLLRGDRNNFDYLTDFLVFPNISKKKKNIYRDNGYRLKYILETARSRRTRNIGSRRTRILRSRASTFKHADRTSTARCLFSRTSPTANKIHGRWPRPPNRFCVAPQQVHPCGRYRHNTVVFVLAKEHNLRNLRTIHRLDRLTSGLLMFGRTPRYARIMEAQIRNRQVNKQYVCRVEGRFPE